MCLVYRKQRKYVSLIVFKSSFKLLILLIGVKGFLVVFVVFSLSYRGARNKLHRCARHPNLVSSGSIPAPSKNVVTRFEVLRNHDGVLPQGGGALYVLPSWPPCAALGEGALLQVSLFELLPLGGDHLREVEESCVSPKGGSSPLATAD